MLNIFPVKSNLVVNCSTIKLLDDFSDCGILLATHTNDTPHCCSLNSDSTVCCDVDGCEGECDDDLFCGTKTHEICMFSYEHCDSLSFNDDLIINLALNVRDFGCDDWGDCAVDDDDDDDEEVDVFVDVKALSGNKLLDNLGWSNGWI